MHSLNRFESLLLAVIAVATAASDAGCNPPPPATPPAKTEVASETIMVLADGRGRTESEAIDSAIKSAIENAVGSVLVARGIVENDRLVFDRIVSTTAGFQERYEKVRVERLPDGWIEVHLRVWVRTAPIERAANFDGLVQDLGTGPDLANRIRTLRRREHSAAETLEAVFEAWPAEVLDAAIVSDRKRSFGQVEPGVVEVVVEVWIDPVRWENWIRSASGVFRACSESVVLSRWTLEDAGSFSLSAAIPDGILVGGIGMDRALRDPRDRGPLVGFFNVVPPSARPATVFFGPNGSPDPRVPPETAASVVLFGSDAGTGIGFLVRPEVRSRIREAITRVPRVEVALIGDGGRVQAKALVDWKATDWFGDVASPSAGEIGRSELRAAAVRGRGLGQYSAAVGFQWERLVAGRSGPVVIAPVFLAKNLATIESRTGITWSSSAILTPRLRFPFRFKVSDEELDRIRDVELRWADDEDR